MKLQEHKARQEQYNFRPRRRRRRPRAFQESATDATKKKLGKKRKKRRPATLPPDVTVIITVMRHGESARLVSMREVSTYGGSSRRSGTVSAFERTFAG